jgi:hypothetical protein
MVIFQTVLPTYGKKNFQPDNNLVVLQAISAPHTFSFI